MKGIVFKSTGKWYKVQKPDGSFIEAQMKGKIRLQDFDVTNPIAVGDEVILEKFDKTWMISSIEERNNFIIRVSPKRKHYKQIIASNIDQAILVVTLHKPRTSTGFIDRFILTAEAYHIPTVIVFNKQDILLEKDAEKQAELVACYNEIGYKTMLTSATTGEGIDALKEQLKGRTSLFSGHSGVGKSTLSNAIEPSLNLKTKDVSKKFRKGVHTTTHAEMHALSFGGNVIDVPGIKEFGIVYLDKYEIAQYFVEFKEHAVNCKFSNCLHVEEPKCAVKEALNEGLIAPDRYINYLNILTSLDEIKEY